MDYRYAQPEHRLYEASERWLGRTRRDGSLVTEAARLCLDESLDSPALRRLADTPPFDDDQLLTRRLQEALSELRIPEPAPDSPWVTEVAAGRSFALDPVDRIRFEVSMKNAEWGGPELLVYVNEAEATVRGAGLGMDPIDLIAPHNRLVATEEHREVPIAKCGCGAYGCGSTDVRLVRVDDVVHWEWLYDRPFDTGALFPAAHYDDEVARLVADRSWERRIDSIRRTIAHHLDHGVLARHGLRLYWVSDRDRPTTETVDGLTVALLSTRGHDHPQIFVRFSDLRDLDVDAIAKQVIDELAKDPSEWEATHLAHGQGARPRLAGPRWRPRRSR